MKPHPTAEGCRGEALPAPEPPVALRALLLPNPLHVPKHS